MRSSFSQCAWIIALAMLASGCANGKWPWQSSSPFACSSTPGSTSPAGVTKPASLANNAPPSSVTAPPANYPTYQGTAPGMTANNNIAPAYQPTTPPTGSLSPTYTASANNTASRTGASVAPQQGTYQTSGALAPTAGTATNSFGTPTTTTPYNPAATANPYNSGMSTSSGYPTGGSAASQPTPPYGGSSLGTQPAVPNYLRGSTMNANPASANPANPTPPPTAPLTGNYNGGWSGSASNAALPANPPAGSDRYSATPERYGAPSSDRLDSPNNTIPVAAPDQRYGGMPTSLTTDSRYGNTPSAAPVADYRNGNSTSATSAPDNRNGNTMIPASTPDARYGNTPATPAADYRYGNPSNAPTSDARFAPPADNRYNDGTGTTPPGAFPNNSTPPSGSDPGLSYPGSGVSTGGSTSSGAYQPGSVSSYDANNKPSVLTAANPNANTLR